jgi:hypothetical protein
MTLTIVTPYVAAHAELMERAKASVDAQTIPCQFIAVFDEHRQGVARARNEGVRLAQTDLVGFLDADDVLMPDYAEKMLEKWRPGIYTYCDFFFGKHREYRPTKDCILWKQERRHTVSCVISKADFERVGGFDTSYLKAEDVEFWARCHQKGVHGLRVPHALLHYTDDKPVKRYELQDQVGRYLQKIYREYAGVITMGCCGEQGATPLKIPSRKDKQEGDVLVKVNWAGNKTFHGKATGRDYPYNGNGKLAWIDPRDQKEDPKSFVLVEVAPEEAVKKPDASSVVVIESTGGVSQEWRETIDAEDTTEIEPVIDTPSDSVGVGMKTFDSFQDDEESAVSSKKTARKSAKG